MSSKLGKLRKLSPELDAAIRNRIEWSGTPEDDCVARWNGLVAHCEVMSDYMVRDECGEPLPRSQQYRSQDWWFAVYRRRECLFTSSDAGGGVTTGSLARAICEHIMRAEHERRTRNPHPTPAAQGDGG